MARWDTFPSKMTREQGQLWEDKHRPLKEIHLASVPRATDNTSPNHCLFQVCQDFLKESTHWTTKPSTDLCPSQAGCQSPRAALPRARTLRTWLSDPVPGCPPNWQVSFDTDIQFHSVQAVCHPPRELCTTGSVVTPLPPPTLLNSGGSVLKEET